MRWTLLFSGVVSYGSLGANAATTALGDYVAAGLALTSTATNNTQNTTSSFTRFRNTTTSTFSSLSLSSISSGLATHGTTSSSSVSSRGSSISSRQYTTLMSAADGPLNQSTTSSTSMNTGIFTASASNSTPSQASALPGRWNASATSGTAPSLLAGYSGAVNSTAYAFPTASMGATAGNLSVDECWNSWNDYWESGAQTYDGSTYTSTWTQTLSEVPASTQYFTVTEDVTWTVTDAGFVISTLTSSFLSTFSNAYEGQADTTFTSTSIVTDGIWVQPTATPSVTPTCKLPSSVSQCQESWSSWISAELVPSPTPPPHCFINADSWNTSVQPACAVSYTNAISAWANTAFLPAPQCTQASIGEDTCQSIRDNYVAGENFMQLQIASSNAGFQAGSISVIPGWSNTTGTWYWPTSSTLGGVPSCTLGCGRCAVTGGTVELLYWPTTATITGPVSEDQPVTAVVGDTTLTSPTLYISFSNVHAADGCGTVGPQISSTIVAIPTDMPLSSIYGGPQNCNGIQVQQTSIWTATASFNVADLNSPVPYSIYSSQPWCASYSRQLWHCDGLCPTDSPYRPILVVPNAVFQSLDPAWATCFADVRGVYDPPSALQPVSSEAAVGGPSPATTTSAAPVASTPAVPASNPQTPVPVQTSAAASAASPTQTSASASTPGQQSLGSPASIPPSANPSPDPQEQSSGDPNSPATPAEPQTATQNPPSQTTSQNALSILSAAEGSAQPASTVGDPSQPHNTASPDSSSSTVDPGNAKPAPVITIGSSVATVSANSNAVYIGDTSLTAGQLATISGAVVSAGSSQIVVGGKTISVSPSSPANDPTAGVQAPVVTIGSSLATVSAGSSAIHVGGTSLTPGQVATISGTVISAGSSQLVVGGQTVTVPPSGSSNNPSVAPPTPVITLGGTLATVSAGPSAVYVGGTNLTVGQVATISGTVISAGSSQIVVGGQTIAIPSSGATNAAATTILGASSSPLPVTRSGSAYIVAGSTLLPNQQVTIAGEVYSALPSGNGVVAGGSSTISIANDPSVNGQATTVYAGGSTPAQISRSGSVYYVDGTSLDPGQQITQNGHIFSELLSGSGIVVDGSSTVSLAEDQVTSVPVGVATPVPISRSGSVYIVGHTSLTPGQQVTVGGQVYSELPNGAGVVVDGTSTLSVPDGQATTVSPNGPVVSRSGSAYLVDGTTLSPGQQVTADGQTFSELSNGDGVVIDGTSTVSLDNGKATSLPPMYPYVVTKTGSDYIVDGVTLSPGAAATIAGQVVSEESNGNGVVIGTRTVSLNDLNSDLVPEATLIAGSSTLTAYGVPGVTGEAVVDGYTLSVGGSAVTINGETLSEGSSGLVVIQSGATSTLSSVGVQAPTLSTSPASSASVSPAAATSSKKSAAFASAAAPVMSMLLLAMTSVLVITW